MYILYQKETFLPWNNVLKTVCEPGIKPMALSYDKTTLWNIFSDGLWALTVWNNAVYE